MVEFKYCKYCGSKIDENSIFCNYCGKNLRLIYYGKDTNSQAKSLFSKKNLIWGIIAILAIYTVLNSLSNYENTQNDKYTTSTMNTQNTVETPKTTTAQTTTSTTTNKTKTNTPTVKNTTSTTNYYSLTIGPTHINASGDDNYNLNDEWVSIRCTSGSVNLSGWKIKDGSTHIYYFKNITIKEGQTIRVYTGCGNDTSTSLYWCNDGAVWNNDGDTLKLIKPDGSVYGSWNVYIN